MSYRAKQQAKTQVLEEIWNALSTAGVAMVSLVKPQLRDHKMVNFT